jgi:signal transduction histidine kinase
MMPRIVSLRVCLALLAMTGGIDRVDAASFSWLSPGLRRIQSKRESLLKTLSTLPPEPAPQLTDRLGYHSGYSSSPETVEWVELYLQREEPLDAVVLVPAASSGGGAMSPGYGFPLRFRVELSESADHAERVVIADYTRADFPNPGVLPVYINAGGQRARFVRITATRLFRDGDRALFALGEVMLLQGKRNIATRLARSDFTYSRTTGAMPVWGLSNLVDGHSALGPPEGAQPSPTLGYCSRPVNLDHEPHPQPRWVQVDLGEVLPVDEVRLFPAHPPEFAHRPGYGWPPRLKVEISDDADFRNAVELPGFQDGSGVAQRDPVSPGDNAMSFPARNESARYVRVSAPRLFDANGHFLFALAEMQVWSGDANVALGRPVSAFDSVEEKGWSRAALVDGFTSKANILDWPEWLSGLSKRRETLQEIALLEERRARIVRLWKLRAILALSSVAVAAIAAAILWVLRQRRARRLELEALRQRIARDLHDDIGSSLGSIALIAQDVIASGGDAAHVRGELAELQGIASETVEAMRDITRLIQSNGYGAGDLAAHLRETAARLLRGVPHTLTAEDGATWNQLPMDQQRDLILMFKEMLHNILRHARATAVNIILAHSRGQLTLTVRDNGCGFDPAASASNGMGLANLRRRAAKHGGAVHIASAPAHGATLTITLPRHA